MTPRWNVVVAGLICLGMISLVLVDDAFGQRKPLVRPTDLLGIRQANKGEAVAKNLEVVWYGNSACSNKGCHGGDPPKGWFKNPDTGKQYELISRCTEADLFATHDKHADAYKVITGTLGKQMSKVLKYDVTKAPGCLSCHGVAITDDKVRKASVAVGFDINEGVSCAVCHGPHREWVANHGIMVSAGKFRGLSREKKETDYGMRNLQDPIRRSELCVSCHVGNLAENKFVTHEMYAAGHPPLPGFEMATFSNAQPRHWQYLREKSPALQKELGLREGELEETELVLIGGLVAFRETMVLLHTQSAEAIKTKDEAKKILDLSNFDCWACHHDLKKQSWRQTKEWIGSRTPGRPPVRDWSVELAQLAIDYLAFKSKNVDGKALKKDFTTALANLHQAISVRNGGDPVRIEKASAALVKLTDNLAQEIQKSYPTTGDARGLVSGMPSEFGKRLRGYDSARQVAWGFEAMFNELNGPKGGPMAVRKSLASIDEKIGLQLPSGRKTTIEDSLNSRMKLIDDYDPFEFRKMLNGLGAGLKSKE